MPTINYTAATPSSNHNQVIITNSSTPNKSQCTHHQTLMESSSQHHHATNNLNLSHTTCIVNSTWHLHLRIIKTSPHYHDIIIEPPSIYYWCITHVRPNPPLHGHHSVIHVLGCAMNSFATYHPPLHIYLVIANHTLLCHYHTTIKS